MKTSVSGEFLINDERFKNEKNTKNIKLPKKTSKLKRIAGSSKSK